MNSLPPAPATTTDGMLQMRGYHMTEAEDRHLQGQALLVLATARQRYALVKAKTEVWAKKMESLVQLVRANNVAIDCCEDVLSAAHLRQMLEDVKLASEELDAANNKAQQLGCPMNYTIAKMLNGV